MKEVLNFWWLLVGLATFPLAWWGGYLSSIRSERWKRYYGYSLCLITMMCLILANVFSPKTSGDFGLATITAWVIVSGALIVVFIVGWNKRRSKSKFRRRFSV